MNVVSLRLMLLSAGSTKITFIFDTLVLSFRFSIVFGRQILMQELVVSTLWRPSSSFLLGSNLQEMFWWYFKPSFPFFSFSFPSVAYSVRQFLGVPVPAGVGNVPRSQTSCTLCMDVIVLWSLINIMLRWSVVWGVGALSDRQSIIHLYW
jgi:hypothetical protein